MQLTLKQTLLALAIILGVVLLAMWLGYSIGRSQQQKSDKSVTANQPIRPISRSTALNATGPKTLEMATQQYDASLKPGDAPTAEATVPQPVAATEPASGAWRISIMSTDQNHKAEFERVRKFLADHGHRRRIELPPWAAAAL